MRTLKWPMTFFIPVILFCSCQDTNNPGNNYHADLNFLAKHTELIELQNNNGESRIIIVPAWQGRVMTSTASGKNGQSYGWINYELIKSQRVDDHFNAFGGEERLWLGPEGGPYSLFFAPGTEQSFQNWYVPDPIDIQPFETVSFNNDSAVFVKKFDLANYAGTVFRISLNRTVRLLTSEETEETLNIRLGDSLKYVAYETSNIIQNAGSQEWTRDKGLISIWMLSMFSISPGITVFIPFREDPDTLQGPVVSDDYFNRLGEDRLKVDNGIIYYKIDGQYRSKIGVSRERALEIAGSYHAQNRSLNILWFEKPEVQHVYLNSKWGAQGDPFNGDVINSYNDGPTETGEQLGPFYELESSSPAAELAPGKSLTHKQRIFHFEGTENELNRITQQVFGVSLSKVNGIFTPDK
jgi:hypothetical protein